MVLLDIMMPKACTECPVRMECRVYCNWLIQEKAMRPPTPQSSEDCMIHDASGYLQYLDDRK